MPVTQPRVTVLLATRNGRKWIAEQVETILNQDGVTVHLVVSDDMSDDGTWEWLQAQTDPRITLLPRSGESGGAAANFYRLLDVIDLEDCDVVAFADQDDRWLPGKLAAQAALVGSGYDGVSSDVTAFDAAGNRTLIRKSYPQRRFDYVFESPGPGCTFVFSRRLAAETRQVLREPGSSAPMIEFHDWLVYALCRAKGWSWLIQDVAWVDYRQHETNMMGANTGIRGATERLRRIRSSWHRSEAGKVITVALGVAAPDIRPQLAVLDDLLVRKGPIARVKLAGHARQMRRRPRDQFIMGMLTAVGIW